MCSLTEGRRPLASITRSTDTGSPASPKPPQDRFQKVTGLRAGARPAVRYFPLVRGGVPVKGRTGQPNTCGGTWSVSRKTQEPTPAADVRSRV